MFNVLSVPDILLKGFPFLQIFSLSYSRSVRLSDHGHLYKPVPAAEFVFHVQMSGFSLAHLGSDSHTGYINTDESFGYYCSDCSSMVLRVTK